MPRRLSASSELTSSQYDFSAEQSVIMDRAATTETGYWRLQSTDTEPWIKVSVHVLVPSRDRRYTIVVSMQHLYAHVKFRLFALMSNNSTNLW